jgi:hypothetical protein
METLVEILESVAGGELVQFVADNVGTFVPFFPLDEPLIRRSIGVLSRLPHLIWFIGFAKQNRTVVRLKVAEVQSEQPFQHLLFQHWLMGHNGFLHSRCSVQQEGDNLFLVLPAWVQFDPSSSRMTTFHVSKLTSCHYIQGTFVRFPESDLQPQETNRPTNPRLPSFGAVGSFKDHPRNLSLPRHRTGAASWPSLTISGFCDKYFATEDVKNSIGSKFRSIDSSLTPEDRISLSKTTMEFISSQERPPVTTISFDVDTVTCVLLPSQLGLASAPQTVRMFFNPFKSRSRIGVRTSIRIDNTPVAKFANIQIGEVDCNNVRFALYAVCHPESDITECVNSFYLMLTSTLRQLIQDDAVPPSYQTFALGDRTSMSGMFQIGSNDVKQVRGVVVDLCSVVGCAANDHGSRTVVFLESYEPQDRIGVLSLGRFEA